MRILYLAIKFDWGNENVHTDLIRALCEKDHSVTVVACDDAVAKDEMEILNEHLTILKVKTGNQFEKNLIKKGINMILLEKKMIQSIKRNLSDLNFDLLLYSTPPISFSKVVKYCKNTYDCKTYLALKDIFPQNAVDLGMFNKGSLIYKYFKRKETMLYEYSDKIGCMSQGNLDYILKHNAHISKNKLEIFPNAHIVRKYPVEVHNNERTTFILGGNLGKPQGLKNLLNLIENLKDFDLATFVIIGAGSEESLLKTYISEHQPSNLIFKKHLPKKEYDEYVKQADVGLISLDTRFTIPNIPSKLLNYMELSKPVLAITDINTDLKDIIEDSDCGWWVSGEKLDVVEKTLKDICNAKQEILRKGASGREYFEENFNVFENVKQLENFINMEE